VAKIVCHRGKKRNPLFCFTKKGNPCVANTRTSGDRDWVLEGGREKAVECHNASSTGSFLDPAKKIEHEKKGFSRNCARQSAQVLLIDGKKNCKLKCRITAQGGKNRRIKLRK